MPRKVTSAGGVIFDGSRVLLVDHEGGYGFAKGHVDPGERIVKAAVREVGEETCIVGRVRRYLGTVTRQSLEYDVDPPEIVEKDVVIFLMDALGETGLPYERHTTPVWVEAADAAAGMKHPEEAEFFNQYILPLVDVAANKSFEANS